MGNVVQRVCLASIIVVLLFVTLNTGCVPPRGRRHGKKRKRTGSPAAATAAASPARTNPLSFVRWDTIMNMLHWKAEMSRLDDIIESIQP